MNSSPKILIAAPVSSRGWILPYYLKCLTDIDYPKELISFYFIINNSNDDSEKILSSFKENYSQMYSTITIERYKSSHKAKDKRIKNVRAEYTYNHLSILRNKILDFASIQNFDYCLSVDTDILVSKDILRKLLSHHKDVVSGVIYNGFLVNPLKPWKYPNIMRLAPNGCFEHIANSYVKNSATLSESKLVQVDGTGALVLISKEVCQNTRYGFHEQGEDLYWSLDCRQKGYDLYSDYSAYAFHAMSKELLEDFISTKFKGDI